MRLRGGLSGAERRAFDVVVACEVTSGTLWDDDAVDDAVDDGNDGWDSLL